MGYELIAIAVLGFMAAAFYSMRPDMIHEYRKWFWLIAVVGVMAAIGYRASLTLSLKPAMTSVSLSSNSLISVRSAPLASAARFSLRILLT